MDTNIQVEAYQLTLTVQWITIQDKQSGVYRSHKTPEKHVTIVTCLCHRRHMFMSIPQQRRGGSEPSAGCCQTWQRGLWRGRALHPSPRSTSWPTPQTASVCRPTRRPATYSKQELVTYHLGNTITVCIRDTLSTVWNPNKTKIFVEF